MLFFHRIWSTDARFGVKLTILLMIRFLNFKIEHFALLHFQTFCFQQRIHFFCIIISKSSNLKIKSFYKTVFSFMMHWKKYHQFVFKIISVTQVISTLWTLEVLIWAVFLLHATELLDMVWIRSQTNVFLIGTKCLKNSTSTFYRFRV